MEEYYNGKRPTNPQSFWGLVWNVYTEADASVMSVSSSTCFEKVKTCSKGTNTWCQSQVDYKNNIKLCGPNLWHMDASCSRDESSQPLINEYLKTLDFEPATSKQLKTWMKGDPTLDEGAISLINDQTGIKWNGELCKSSKIKSIVSFATDSHSYSFLTSGNSSVYLLTALAIILMSVVSDLMSLWHKETHVGFNAFLYIVQIALFFAMYVVYFVLWNRNTDLSMVTEHLYKIKDGVWTLDKKCDSQKEVCQLLWGGGDSCAATILLAWVVFSYHAWLVWSSESTKYEFDDQHEVSATPPQADWHQPPPGDVWVDEQKPQSGWAYPYGASSRMGYMMTDDQDPLMLDGDLQLKNIPTATSEMNDMPIINYHVMPEVSQSSHVFSCTVLFLYPLLVATCLSSRKFSPDNFLQSRLVTAVLFAVLQYVFVAVDWVSSMAWSVESRKKPKLFEAIRYLKWVCCLMQFLLVLIQILILVYYITGSWPSGYIGNWAPLGVGIALILYNAIQFVVTLLESFSYKIPRESFTWFLQRLWTVLIFVLTSAMYFYHFHQAKMIEKKLATDIGISDLMYQHWVYGVNYALPDMPVFNYAIPASYL